jgi:hypothetical protein
MPRLLLIAAFLLSTLFSFAQLKKAEAEKMINSINMSDVAEIYLIRTRHPDGTQGWFEKFEKLDSKSCKVTFNEGSMLLEGNAYQVLLPYDKIKLIFFNKHNYLTIEMTD